MQNRLPDKGASPEEFKARQVAQKQADAGIASMLNDMQDQDKVAQANDASHLPLSLRLTLLRL